MDDRSYNNPSNNVVPTGGMPGNGVAMPNSGTMANGSAMVNGSAMLVGGNMSNAGMMANSGVNNSAMPVGGTMSGTEMPNGDAIYSGGMTPGNGLISSGTGDIVLNNGGGGKPKKGLIIGVIVGVLVIVGLVVGVVMMSGGVFIGGKNGFNSINVSDRMLKDFNKFANYVTGGKESEDNLTAEYSVNEKYYFITHQHTLEEQRELFEKTEELFDAFSNSYIDDSNSDLNDIIINEREILDFMKIVYGKKVIADKDIISAYAGGGEVAANEYMKSYYDFSGIEKNQYVESFKKDLEQWMSDEGKYLNFVNAAGCLSVSYIDASCSSRLASQKDKETLSQLEDDLAKDKASLEVYYDLVNSFIKNVFIINSIVHDRKLDDLMTKDDTVSRIGREGI